MSTFAKRHRRPILNASKAQRVRPKAEIVALNAPRKPFECNGRTEVFTGPTPGWSDAGYLPMEYPEILTDAYAMFPGTDPSNLFPSGLNDREKAVWQYAMMCGVMDRDRHAPRWPRLLIETQAAKAKKTPHQIEWEMYGPENYHYCPALSIEQHYEAESLVPQLEYELLRKATKQSRDYLQDTIEDATTQIRRYAQTRAVVTGSRTASTG